MNLKLIRNKINERVFDIDKGIYRQLACKQRLYGRLTSELRSIINIRLSFFMVLDLGDQLEGELL